MRYFIILLLWSICIIPAAAQSEWQKHESPVQADLHNIHFANNSLGWIVTHNTGDILHTKDGGNSWIVQAKKDSIYFEDIYFLDKNTGWISGQYGLVFKTEDGGNNWRKKKIWKEDAWIYSIHFHDKNDGLAVGIREKGPTPVFLETTTGGSRWKDIKAKVPSSFYEPVHFFDNRRGYVAGGSKIIYTADGGKSWETQFADTSSASDCKEAIRGMTFQNPNNGWAVGHCGQLLHTDDGHNWSKMEKFTTNRLRSVRFINKSVGYIVGDANREPGVLYRTTDGGKTWKAILKNTPDLHRITLTDKRIWLVGDQGTILSKPR